MAKVAGSIGPENYCVRLERCIDLKEGSVLACASLGGRRKHGASNSNPGEGGTMQEPGTPRGSSPLVRGLMVLVVVILAVGTIAPAFSAGNVTKAKVKRIAAKEAAKQVDKALMAATVPVGDSCAITAQTGGITAADSGNQCDVTFPQTVENCVVGATPLHPSGDFGGEATIRKLSGANVKVGRYDSAGGTPTRGLFSIYAVC